MNDFARPPPHPCASMQLLLQAEVDGELDAAAAASLAAHVAGCAGCAATRARLHAVSAAVRATAPRYAAPDALRAAIARSAAPKPRRSFRARDASWFGGGALAAGLAFFLLAVSPGSGSTTDAIVSDHIRALQPGHLLDVVSDDRHTVRPWFDGKLDFAPPVRDLASVGFPLVGARLDAVNGHIAAALVYRHDTHVINLFVWPDRGGDTRVTDLSGGGYAVVRWRQDGMAFWAVSDVEPTQLRSFASLWRDSG